MKKFCMLMLCAFLLLSLCACTNEAVEQNAALYEKYADLIDALEEGNYNYALGHVATLAQQAQAGQEERPVPVQVLSDTWYLYPSDSNHIAAPALLSFAQDGTATLDGSPVTWLEQNSWDNGNSGVLVQDGENKYCFSMRMGKSGLSSVTLYTCRVESDSIYSGNQVAVYYNHPLASALLRSWDDLDMDAGMPDYLSINWEKAYISEEIFDFTITSQPGDPFITASCQAENGSGVGYDLRMEERDGHYIVTLTGSSGMGVYYNRDFGVEEDWNETVYPFLMQQLRSYLDSGYLWLENTTYSGNDALKYLFSSLTELGDYKDCPQLLARFSSLPNRILFVNQHTVDQLGNESNVTLSRYTYNPDGTLATGMGSAFMEYFGIYNTSSSYNYYISYDESGLIAEVRLGWNMSDVKAIGTPVYDDKGNLVSMQVQCSDGTYTSRFTYDDKGRLLALDIPEYGYNDDYHYTYTYDDKGNLLQKVVSWDNGNYRETTDYVYAEGILVKEVCSHAYRYGEDYTTEYIYTNDDVGFPVLAEIFTTGASSSYKTMQNQYIYDTVYFFDSEGLKMD